MKTNKIMVLFILIIFLMFIGSMYSLLTFPAIILSSICAIIIALDSKENDYMVCIGILLLLIFQNFCIGFGAHLAGNSDSSLSFITQIPFLTIFIIWTILILNENKKKKFNIKGNSLVWFILLIFSIIFSLFIGRGDIKAIISSVRNLSVFYMSYRISKKYICKKETFELFYFKYQKLIVLIFVIGLIFFIVGYPLYNFFGVNEVLLAKGSKVLNGNLSNRFVTNVFSFYVPRMSSLYFEPVNLAYLFAISFILCVYYDERSFKQKIIIFIISLTGLILTFGKGGYLIVLLTVLFNKLFSFWNILAKRFHSKFRNIMLIVIVLGIGIIFLKIYLSKYTNSYAMPHIWAILQTFKSIKTKPIGHGLGTGGNAARIFGNLTDDYLSVGGESAIMSFTYQIGVQGLLCLIFCLINLFPYKNEYANNKFLRVMTFIPVVILVVGLFQENTFTPQCIVIYMFVLGAIHKINVEGGAIKSENN